MIHKIRAMCDEGNGSSIKEISRSLGLSRNTVRKYLRMNEQTAQEYLEAPQRHKSLDVYRGYLKHLLTHFPGLKTPKMHRKLMVKAPDLDISERTLRRYLNRLRRIVAAAQQRYYEPVIDEVPGVQAQQGAATGDNIQSSGDQPDQEEQKRSGEKLWHVACCLIETG